MRFLIDENVPFGIVKLLSSLNHDVLDVAASPLRGSNDKVLWSKAAEEGRILITRDLDYPIVGLRPAPYGVILMRMPAALRADQITRTFRESLRGITFDDLKDKVAVIEPGRIRISPLP